VRDIWCIETVEDFGPDVQVEGKVVFAWRREFAGGIVHLNDGLWRPARSVEEVKGKWRRSRGVGGMAK
jgi:hypothetical protein